MKLSDAARYFDDCSVLDINDTFLFKAQLDIYDKSTSEGASASRRTLNAAPGVVVIPPEKILKIDSKIYIAGNQVQDSFKGKPIRDSVILQGTNVSSVVFVITELLDIGNGIVPPPPADPEETRAFLSWRKSQKEELRTSEIFNLYDIYLPRFFDVNVGSLVTAKHEEGTLQYFLVRSIELSNSGFSKAVTYDLGVEAIQTVSYYRSTGYDPASGDGLFSAPVSLVVLGMDYKAGYDLESYSSKKFELGDYIFMTSDVDAKAKDYLLRGNDKYKALSVFNDVFGISGLRSIHGRRV